MITSQKKPAFTLVEILISISIFAILTAIMFGGFSQEKNRGAVKLAADQLQVDLQGVQQNSQSGIVSPLSWCLGGTSPYYYCTQASHCGTGGQCVTRPPVGGFGLNVDNSGGILATSYSVFADLPGPNPLMYDANTCTPPLCNRDALVKTVNLPANIRVNSIAYTGLVVLGTPNVTNITFSGIKGDATLWIRTSLNNIVSGNNVNTVTITLKHTRLNLCYAVTIQRVGGVVTKRQLNSSCP